MARGIYSAIRRLFLSGVEGEPFIKERQHRFSHTIYLMTSGPARYIQAVHESIVVFDGATGTNLQARALGPDDFGGPSFEGCNELLCVTRPDVIADLHRSFFDVGCHVVETNSFGSIPWVLAEYGISSRAGNWPRPRRPSPGTSQTATAGTGGWPALWARYEDRLAGPDLLR